MQQDFKKFTIGERNIATAQVNAMDKDDLNSIKKKLKPYLEENIYKYNVDMIFILLTNISDSSSELLACGSNAEELARKAFNIDEKEETLYLSGVVSRKKQFIPSIMNAIQQEEL